MSYLRYAPEVEEIGEDEPALFAKIAETFEAMGEQVAREGGRAVRVSHAKATAIVTGELEIASDLPPELAQGIAARPGKYEATVRFAQGPGELLHDRVSTHRGMAVKLHGVEGETIAESSDRATQDFVLEAKAKAFINATAERFYANLRAGVSNAPSMPEVVKSAISSVAHATETAIEAVGLESKTLDFFGHEPLHPLAEAYFSQVPMRWGDHVGKVGCFPTAETYDGLAKVKIDTHDDHDAFRDAMLDHFRSKGAAFELRVQLATDPETTPIEDASKEWPEEDNPYRTVATLRIPPQTAWSPERDADAARLSFRPANSLVAHRPLGSVMRARLFVYERLADWRREYNGVRPAKSV